jgi:hypothetical protein
VGVHQAERAADVDRAGTARSGSRGNIRGNIQIV